MMENDGLKKYFMNGFDGQGMILDRYDDTIPVDEDKILVVYYRYSDKEPSADITSYNSFEVKTDKPVDTNFRPDDKCIIWNNSINLTANEPLGKIYTIKNIETNIMGQKSCAIVDDVGGTIYSPCSTLIPYNKEIDTVMKKFYTEKNIKDKEKQESKKLHQKISLSLIRNVGNLSSQTGKNIDNISNLARNVGKSVALNTNNLYDKYRKSSQRNSDAPTNKNKIKAQMVTMFFNTFFMHRNNERISIKPNTLFIICNSDGVKIFEGGRTYEISRENCPRVYTNIIGSIHHQDDKSVITCDELFEIFFKQSTFHIPATHFHVYINVQQKEK